MSLRSAIRLGCIVLALIALVAMVWLAVPRQGEPLLSDEPTAPPPSPSPTPPPLTLERVRQTSFADVPSEAPYRDAVGYAACAQLLGGTGQGYYSPELYVHRGCAATVLSRLSGEDIPHYAGEFSDVSAGDWYAAPAAWSVSRGLLTAFDGGAFHPQEPVDRATLAGMLWRLEGKPAAAEEKLDEYWDGADVAQEDRAALAWCLDRGYFDGFTDREAHPGYLVTRAQLAQVITALQGEDQPVAKAVADAQRTARASRSVANHQALQAAIDGFAKGEGAMAVQVAVLEQGRVTDSFVYGRADRTALEVVDVRTGESRTVDMGELTLYHKFRVASISKVVVGMNAMALAEKGRFDLDGSIGQYWDCQAVNRAYPDVAVSPRSILSHTSSIIIYGDSTSRRYDAVRSRLAGGDFANLKPGDINSWGYNNYAFGVLGMTLELAEGRRYDDIADENFFLPLAIDAGVVPGELDHPEYIATLYRHNGEVGWSAASQRNSKYIYAPGDYGNYFCGGLTASAVDIAKLYGVLAGDGAFEGQRLLSRESVEAMETPLGQPYSMPFEQCYPLRCQRDIYGRDRLYYHTGSAYGVYNLASYDPDTGDGVVVLSTGATGATDSHGIYTICAKISQQVYDVLSGQTGETEETKTVDREDRTETAGQAEVKADVKTEVKTDH